MRYTFCGISVFDLEIGKFSSQGRKKKLQWTVLSLLWSLKEMPLDLKANQTKLLLYVNDNGSDIASVFIS